MERKRLEIEKAENRELKITLSYNRNTLAIENVNEDRLQMAIGYGLIACGISAANMPEKIGKDVLSEFLRNNYPDYTPEEIKYAFEKAMARKFGPEVDVKCYGSFSCEYIGRILSAYENWIGVHGEHIGWGPVPYQKVNTAYRQFLEGNIPEHYSIDIYEVLKNENLGPSLSRSQERRPRPFHLAILTAFTHFKRIGLTDIFTLDEKGQVLNRIK